MVFCNMTDEIIHKSICSHNPYFNRWFSAIGIKNEWDTLLEVTILILIDGFLQSKSIQEDIKDVLVTILILIDGFLQLS